MPKRIQLKRLKGWRMPPNTVSVARPGRYGNPAAVGSMVGRVVYIETAEEAVAFFREIYQLHTWASYGLPSPSQIADELHGKDVACWCRPKRPCHGDVVLEIANG